MNRHAPVNKDSAKSLILAYVVYALNASGDYEKAVRNR